MRSMKRKGEVVLSGRVVEFSVINTHPPFDDHSYRDELILLILNSSNTAFLGTIYTELA